MWFALALGAALAQAAQFAVVKARARHLHPLVIMLGTQLIGLAVWSVVAWLGRVSFTALWRLGGWVIAAVVVAAVMNYLLARASASGDLSIVAPILALAPVVSVVPDWLFTGTLPRGIGWAGVAVTVLGTLALSRSDTRRVDPRGLLTRDDALCAVGAAVAFGILSAIDRRVAIDAGVPAYLATIYACQVPLTALLLRVRRPAALAAAGGRRNVTTLVLHGGVATLSVAMQVTAVSLAPVAYVNSVRQLSTVFTVLVGRVLFDEPGLGQRLAGAILMGTGAAILLFAR